MKKNKMLRIASVMLVLALITTCVISGTFAKYITTAKKADTARVAEWGVEFSSPSGSVFKKNYNGLAVTSGEKEIVAPGTSNSTGMAFTMSGKPEVKYRVSFSLTCTSDVKLPGGASVTYPDFTTAADDTFPLTADYTPVKFSLKGKLNGEAINIEDKSMTEMVTAMAAVTKDYPANTELTAANNTLTLTWTWAQDENNMADTVLGNIAAGKYTPPDGASTTLNYTITMTAEQIFE